MRKIMAAAAWEIRRNSSLSFLGIVLSLAQIITYFHWLTHPTGLLDSNPATPPLCWKIFPHCDQWTWFSHSFLQALLTIALVNSIVAFTCFFSRRALELGWLTIAFAGFIQGITFLLDSSLHSNEMVLLTFSILAFLFIPQRALLVRNFIVSAYVMDGLLKLNGQWLSGVWLADIFPKLPIKGLETLAALILLTEMVAPFALLFLDYQRFFIGMILLVALQSLKWYFVGYYEPLLALLFLAFVVRYHFERLTQEREYLYQSFIQPEPTHLWWPIAFAVFLAIQATAFGPQVGRDLLAALRFRSVNLPQHCEVLAFNRFKGKTSELPMTFSSPTAPEYKCHPALFTGQLKGLCKKWSSRPGYEGLTGTLLIHRSGGLEAPEWLLRQLDHCEESAEEGRR